MFIFREPTKLRAFFKEQVCELQDHKSK